MIVGILLAAGRGRRIGTPKALLKLAGETFHARSIRTFREAGLEVITVVNSVVHAALPPASPDEVRAMNPDPDQSGGMFASVRIGVSQAVERDASGAILLPVDHPFVTAGDMAAVVESLAGGASVVLPIHEGRRGHPIGISRSVMNEILAEDSLTTLRDVVHKDRNRVSEIAGSSGVLVGINTREDLQRVSDAEVR